MQTEATVFVVEDDPHVRELIDSALTRTGWNVEVYESPSGFLRSYDPDRPGCLVLDLCLPEMSGLELQAQICEKGGCHPFIVLTGHGDVSQAVKAIQAGAVDFIEKPFFLDSLVDVVRRAIEQDVKNRQAKLQSEMIQRQLDSLTPRERDVLELLLKGKLNKQIAGDLGISTKTVDVHRSHVLKKMHVRSVVQLMQLVR